ncbi:MAG: LPS export ABC transporter periplasmic protein LptC [Blastocatellia bacterium]|nr:LPS export ABC transporter periplasmic protein LptC [Blastocatellia bacterium]
MAFSFPKLFKYLSLFLIVGMVVYLVAYLVGRTNPKGNKPAFITSKLNPNISGLQRNFRYTHNSDNVDRLILTADLDRATMTGEHELEGVKLESFDPKGAPSGVLTSKEANYDGKEKSVFKKEVVITLPNGLVVRTEEMNYNQVTNIATTEALVSFERNNVSGTCVGMVLESNTGRLVMTKDVKVTVLPKDAKAKADQPADKPDETKGKKAKKKEAAQPASESPQEGQPALITGNHAEYYKDEQRIILTGRATLTRGGDELRADQMTAFLDDQQRLQKLEARDHSFLKSEGKQGQVEAKDMDFTFLPTGEVEKAIASGNPIMKTTGDQPAREVAGDKLDVSFVKTPAGNLLQEVVVTGNARVKLFAPPVTPQTPQPVEKELTAQTVQVKFSPDGRFAQTSHAEGNAQLTVTPLVVEPKADRKQVRAPQMDAVFYETDNQIRTFTALGGVRIDLTPLEAKTQRQVRTTQSERATANFDAHSQDVTEVVQEGKFTYAEGVKNATADRATYLQVKETVFLRGHRPTVWDDRSRTQADELDLSSATSENFARGNVRTTYYSPATAGNATPFGKTKTPIFVTSAEGQANSKTGQAVFRGDARAWQDDNFVRGDKLELLQADKKMIATGHVSSALYQVEREDAKKQKQVVPIFGTAEKLTYSDVERRAIYEKNARLVQGDDTLVGQTVEIFLQKQSSQVERMYATGSVVVTQPQRKATGDRAEYTASDDRFVILGNVARVEDTERGTTTGPRLTFIRSDGSVLAVDQRRTQRIRTKHNVEN